MPYPKFDRTRLKVKPLSNRIHDLSLSSWLEIDDPVELFDHPNLPILAKRIVKARENGAAVILMMGGHVIRAGISRHIIDLMKRGLVTHIAMNGGASIHDFELAMIGATTESVAKYIKEGQFGLWDETGRMNDTIIEGAQDGIGMGEALGRAIHIGDFPHRNISVLAAGYLFKVPTTVHIGIGYDIIHEHSNCDGASLGITSYTDFLILAQSIMGLEGGVVLNVGTAVMGPEIYLKGLSMARNVAHQEGLSIRRFTSAVFDLISLEGNLNHEADRGTPEYYFRPYKTILVRTISEGGESFYFRGSHRSTIPTLYQLILQSL
jgi:hypothetical protein